VNKHALSPLFAVTRDLLGPAPRTFPRETRRDIAFARPPWLEANDPLSDAVRKFDRLLSEGSLTWGCVVQANNILWQPGHQAAPAVIVHGLDPDIDPLPSILEIVAQRVASIREQQPVDPGWSQIARVISNDLSRETRVPLPRSLAMGLSLGLSTVLVVPDHLPKPRLAAPILPVLLHPSLTPVIVLPALLWGDDLEQAWLEWDAG